MNSSDKIAAIFAPSPAPPTWKGTEGNKDNEELRERTARQAVAWQHYNLVLPLTDGTELGLRCVVRPEEAQAALLDRLGLKLPRRLRMPRM